jgi:DnaJ-class molecular chaperone
MIKNPYIVLGIHRGADKQDIKQAYRRAVKRSHPDLSSDKDGQRFKEVQDAYDTLKDRDKKKACDDMLDVRNAAESRRRRGSARGPASRPAAENIRQAYRFQSAGWNRRTGSDIYLEIRLSPLEAEAGGDFPVRLALDRQCPACRGSFPWVMLCERCGGSGRLRREEAFSLRIPPGITDGTRTTLLLDESGAPDAVFHLLIRIDPRAG